MLSPWNNPKAVCPSSGRLNGKATSKKLNWDIPGRSPSKRRAGACVAMPRLGSKGGRLMKITIDGKAYDFTPGKTIYEVARDNGIYIPVLCHHDQLKPVGACRVCVVEVEKAKT